MLSFDSRMSEASIVPKVTIAPLAPLHIVPDRQIDAKLT